jgi:DNA-binding MurR/RpiR family transcriptional regulator
MKARTRGMVNEESFKQVKELQKMGAVASRAARFVGLSPATVSRMFNNDNFDGYKAYVASISTSKPKATPPAEPVRNEAQKLSDAIVRLAIAIEESNTKKKSIW